MVVHMRDPFATLLAIQRALDGAMRSDWMGTRTSGRGAFPPINVFRRGEDFTIVAELPGVQKEELDIQIKGDQVRIQGRKSTECDEEVSVHRRERGAGKFDRTLSVPAEIDADRVRAEFRDGVLAVHLPRAESDKARSVSID